MELIWDVVVVAGSGLVAGALARRAGLPRLVGMLLAGVLVGPHGLGLLSPHVLDLSDTIRVGALIVILLKAGLGLDRQQLKSQGSVALRLGVLPATLEATAVAVAARMVLRWDWYSAWLLGWIVCAESPAVIVPGMLRLKQEGWGADHGVPDLMLAGGALSDVVAITLFGIVLDLGRTGASVMGGTLGVQALRLPVQVLGGAVAGYVASRVCLLATQRTRCEEPTRMALVVGGAAACLVVGGDRFGFSGYLATMVLGFLLLEGNRVMARRVRAELDRAWVIAELLLFVLVGAAVNVTDVSRAGSVGILILLWGLFMGRWAGIWLSTVGAALSRNERLFMAIAYTPKATVQAAIGAVPMALGLPNGEATLAVAVLSILVTAPLGAAATSYAAPRMLTRGHVDPTTVSVRRQYCLLVALSNSPSASRVLDESIAIARQLDATLHVVHISDHPQLVHEAMSRHASMQDLEHTVSVKDGDPAEKIVQMAGAVGADLIVMGRGKKENDLSGVTRQVLTAAQVPVILVDT